ncbi:hypothetical protein SteCoe_24717 [Stentor coeruleus]|uniref:Uncharacterized protein n=1 Tax=Stentor coeruleus TaxID=5963 RepID=A0A1R2BGZ9_9CILI|nr:hypothetical protein SteCoe_24717 [Stentor coeruleus]
MDIALSSVENEPITPLSKDTSPKLYKDSDISSSKFFSQNSPIPTEDLIINDNIDFLYIESNSLSSNLTFNLTKTEIASNVSSVFPSFRGSNIFMNSVPHSNNESLSLNRKSYESVEPRSFYERYDSKLPLLKIPQLSVDIYRQNSIKSQPDRQSLNETPQLTIGLTMNDSPPKSAVPIINEVPVDFDISQDSSIKPSEDQPLSLNNTNPPLEIILDKQSVFCSCEWCSII